MSWQQGYSSDDLSDLKELVDSLPADTTGERVRKQELKGDLTNLENAMSELESVQEQKVRYETQIESLEGDVQEAVETIDNVAMALGEIFKNETLREKITSAMPETSADLARFLDSGRLNCAVKISKPKTT